MMNLPQKWRKPVFFWFTPPTPCETWGCGSQATSLLALLVLTLVSDFYDFNLLFLNKKSNFKTSHQEIALILLFWIETPVLTDHFNFSR